MSDDSMQEFPLSGDLSVNIFRTLSHQCNATGTTGPLWAVREFDMKVLRVRHARKARTGPSEQAIRAAIRQAMLNLKLRIEQASKAEIRVLKEQGVLGKRAPSCTLLNSFDTIKLLKAFGRKRVAVRFLTAVAGAYPHLRVALEEEFATPIPPHHRAVLEADFGSSDDGASDGGNASGAPGASSSRRTCAARTERRRAGLQVATGLSDSDEDGADVLGETDWSRKARALACRRRMMHAGRQLASPDSNSSTPTVSVTIGVGDLTPFPSRSPLSVAEADQAGTESDSSTGGESLPEEAPLSENELELLDSLAVPHFRSKVPPVLPRFRPLDPTRLVANRDEVSQEQSEFVRRVQAQRQRVQDELTREVERELAERALEENRLQQEMRLQLEREHHQLQRQQAQAAHQAQVHHHPQTHPYAQHSQTYQVAILQQQALQRGFPIPQQQLYEQEQHLQQQHALLQQQHQLHGASIQQQAQSSPVVSSVAFFPSPSAVGSVGLVAATPSASVDVAPSSVPMEGVCAAAPPMVHLSASAPSLQSDCPPSLFPGGVAAHESSVAMEIDAPTTTRTTLTEAEEADAELAQMMASEEEDEDDEEYTEDEPEGKRKKNSSKKRAQKKRASATTTATGEGSAKKAKLAHPATAPVAATPAPAAEVAPAPAAGGGPIVVGAGVQVAVPALSYTPQPASFLGSPFVSAAGYATPASSYGPSILAALPITMAAVVVQSKAPSPPKSTLVHPTQMTLPLPMITAAAMEASSSAPTEVELAASTPAEAPLALLQPAGRLSPSPLALLQPAGRLSPSLSASSGGSLRVPHDGESTASGESQRSPMPALAAGGARSESPSAHSSPMTSPHSRQSEETDDAFLGVLHHRHATVDSLATSVAASPTGLATLHYEYAAPAGDLASRGLTKSTDELQFDFSSSGQETPMLPMFMSSIAPPEGLFTPAISPKLEAKLQQLQHMQEMRELEELHQL